MVTSQGRLMINEIRYFLLYIHYIFLGSGGCDLSGDKRTAEQSFDHKLTKSNAALALSCNAKFNDKKGNEATDWQQGKPVEVHRSYKFQKYSKYAPEDGVRYVIIKYNLFSNYVFFVNLY